MKKSLLIYGIPLVLAFGGLAAYFLYYVPTPTLRREPVEELGFQPAHEYRNEALHFLLMVPEGFVVSEFPPDDVGVATILVQDTKGDGVQILITPTEDVTVLTPDMIRADIPDLAVTDVQTLNIGDIYKGVAFRSDNEAFGGDSREVWFVYHGNLYQISTYTRLDPLLRAIFATWKFF